MKLSDAIQDDGARRRVRLSVHTISAEAGEGIRVVFRDNERKVHTVWDSYAEFPSARLVTTLLMRTLPR